MRVYILKRGLTKQMTRPVGSTGRCDMKTWRNARRVIDPEDVSNQLRTRWWVVVKAWWHWMCQRFGSGLEGTVIFKREVMTVRMSRQAW